MRSNKRKMSGERSAPLALRKGAPRKIPYSRAFHSDSLSNGGSFKSIANLENRLHYLEKLCERARGQGLENYATGTQSVAMGVLNELNAIYKSVHGDAYKPMSLETFWNKENIRKGVAPFKIGKRGGESLLSRTGDSESAHPKKADGVGILLPEDAARAAAIRKTVEGKKISYKEMRSQMDDSVWHARVEKSIEGQLNEIKRWVKQSEVGRITSLYSNLKELVKQLPPAKKEEWAAQINGIIQKLATDARESGKETDATQLERLLAVRKTEKIPPAEPASTSIVQTASHAGPRRKFVWSKNQKTILVTPAMREEMVRLLKLPAGKFLNVLTRRLDTLQERHAPETIRRAEKKPLNRKSAKSEGSVSRPLSIPRPAFTKNRSWEAEIQLRMSELPKWQQKDVRELVQIAQAAMRYELAATRRGDRKTAQRCVDVGDSAMVTMREILRYPSK